ncbi:hypothetical protein CALVIDRAFT_377835 [Calocera viscosa TUFC12733]|uniref:Uncharacterized protein n=1 Tax=Calocera viscosa (strain TUFC12733) TaxID=1330018 RepID=A0A167Q140_CALVF|nr:hypothetical protein CALVIDRAFT_377835 [Calocera viscosa TUFC12733]
MSLSSLLLLLVEQNSRNRASTHWSTQEAAPTIRGDSTPGNALSALAYSCVTRYRPRCGACISARARVLAHAGEEATSDGKRVPPCLCR